MLLATWRFAAIMLTGLAMGAAFCHLMEVPGKMAYEPELYLRLHRTLYPTFGRTGGVAEILAVVTTIALTWHVRRRRPAFVPTLAAAGFLAVAHLAFWLLVQPANVTMASWPLDAIPQDWTRWRDQWEYTHAARAFLLIAALASLTLSILRESPSGGERPGAPGR